MLLFNPLHVRSANRQIIIKVYTTAVYVRRLKKIIKYCLI